LVQGPRVSLTASLPKSHCACVDPCDFRVSPEAANRRADAFLDGLEEAVFSDVAPAR
jgi:hypothetical protein